MNPHPARTALAAAVLLLACAAASADTPSASSVLDSALKTARARHKPVFVLFGASW